MHLMCDHTHFFKRDGKEAGHYEHDTTPETIKYVGYYTMASKIYKLNDSCKSYWMIDRWYQYKNQLTWKYKSIAIYFELK